MRFAFFFLIALFCSWNSLKAQANSEIPPKIQGHWASPDCGHYTEAVILTRHFYLKSTKKDLTLLQARKQAERKDYWLLRLDDNERPAQIEEDGILKIGIPAGQKSGGVFADLDLDNRMEYAACSEAPTLVPKMMARLMRYIDRIKEECTISITNDCARVLFKMTDANADQKITPSEIKRTVASAFLFAELAEHKTLSGNASEKLAATSKKEGEKITAALLRAHDKNKSGGLDYNELAENFVVPELPVVKDLLVKTGALLPAFRVAAASID